MLNPTALELVGDREIVIHRKFAAPARIVFDAYTRADLVARWWAPTALGVEIVSTEADVRGGGRFRYVIRPRGGEAIGFYGEYREVTPYSRIVYTQVYEPMADLGEVVITVALTEAKGGTQVRFSEMCPSAAVRDGIIASGMERGMRNTFDQLESLVIGMAAD